MTTLNRSIQDVLRKQLGFEIRRTKGNPKEAPTRLVKPNGLKLLHLYDLLRRVNDVPGNIVECGVGWGRSLYAFCLVEGFLKKGRDIYGFDSFEGFPEPSPEDRPEQHPGVIEKGHYATNKDSVLRYLTNSGIPNEYVASRVSLVKGFFSDTLKSYSGGPIALLHLDVDLYQSYRDCLEFFYPLVANGGIIAFDEYQSEGKYCGCKTAVDEFFNGRERILKSDITDRYFLVKGAH